jgi:hypothetical protein
LIGVSLVLARRSLGCALISVRHRRRGDEESQMTQNCILGAAIAVAVSLSITAFAGANDYVFEPVNTQVKKVTM